MRNWVQFKGHTFMLTIHIYSYLLSIQKFTSYRITGNCIDFSVGTTLSSGLAFWGL